MVLKFRGNGGARLWGMRLRAPDAHSGRGYSPWCFALGRWQTLQATLPGSASSYARRPVSARPTARLHAGVAAGRPRLRRSLYVACRQWALAARLCFRRCVTSFARFPMTPWLIPTEVCHGRARPAWGVHKATSHSLRSCLRCLYKPSPFIPFPPAAAVLRARNSAKNGERKG